jgi:ribosomal protein L37AE/L43A
VTHKRFVYQCPMCDRSGLQKDPKAVYKVRICSLCGGRGTAKITAAKRVELDHQLRRKNSNV